MGRLFTYMFRFGGEGRIPPPLSLFVSQQNFMQGMTVKALSQIWKNLHKIYDVIDGDVITLRTLGKKSLF